MKYKKPIKKHISGHAGSCCSTCHTPATVSKGKTNITYSGFRNQEGAKNGTEQKKTKSATKAKKQNDKTCRKNTFKQTDGYAVD